MISARLPATLREALEALAERFPLSSLSSAASDLSAAYRAGRPPSLDPSSASAAYALTRMPATFAALSAVWRGLDPPPASILDLGAGPGAAAWVAAALWPGAAPALTLIEGHPRMRATGESLGPPASNWRGGDFRNLAGFAPHDLVNFSYSLGELPERDALDLIDRAWPLAARALAVIEPGTPRGSAFLLKVRDRLLALGAHIAAPCPHTRACPLAAPDWCHFAVRVERTHVHRLLKGGNLGYEDEKFSYLLAVREPPPAPAARILRHPWQDKGAIRLELCTPGGLATRTVTRREKTLFRAARKASWGEEWSETPDDPRTD